MTTPRLLFSTAVDGYFIAARARRMSEDTLRIYKRAYSLFSGFLKTDPPIDTIDANTVRAFLASLDWLSAKSVGIYRTGLGALWTWALSEGMVKGHVVREAPAPLAPKRQIEPFSQEDVKAILRACDRTAGYRRTGQRPCDNARPTALRDRAIILLLVDSGIRASELCGLRLRDTDLRNRHITVTGKGGRSRTVPVSPRTIQAIWRYIATREDKDNGDRPTFVTATGLPLDRDQLRRLVGRLGIRAGVRGAHPHRFRHTCALECLRHGMNIYALQRLLGHSSLDMVRRYLALAQTDIDTAHRDASPVTNWLL